MARTLYRRDSVFMRAISMAVAFTFVMSVAGTGIAAPAAPEVATAPDTQSGVAQEPAVEPAPPAEEPAEEAPAPAPSVEAQPTTTEPLKQVVRAATPTVKQALGDSGATPFAPQVEAASRIELAALAPYAQFTDVGWEAYRISPASQVGWAKANLGEYREGDWVPVRMFIDNTGGTGDLRLPAFTLEFDHYDTQKNAIGVDSARSFTYSTGTSLPSGPGTPAGASSLAGVTHANGGSTPVYVVNYTPAADVVIPQGQYGVIHFEVHLALTPYWQQRALKFGAREYPGSSAQGRFISWNGGGVGQKTISLPVGAGTIPTGRVDGLKFNDLDHDGVRDAGEPGLAGWQFTLQYGGEFPFSLQTTSAADGTFSFTELPAGSYTITETQQSPWVNSTPNPLSFSLGRDEVTSVRFGNYVPDMTKTWTLSIDTLPAGAVPFVTYKLNGVATTTTLAGPPYTASVDAPYNSAITDIQWFARWMGADIALGSMPDETLDTDLTNTLAYDSSVSGVKFHDLDGDGSRDGAEPGLPGWTIVLKRVVGSTETTFAQTVTGDGGSYSFEDVLPGSYKVYEQNQNGWYNTVAPVGAFNVNNGTTISDKDFGNLELLSSIELDKTGPTLARVGQTVTYAIVVTNTGNYLLTNVLVTDSALGLERTIPSLAPGASATINVDHVVSASDPDPLPNTATALGVDVLGNPVSDSDDHSIDIIRPAITVVKTGSPEMATNPASVTYTYVVTNSGDDTLTAVSLSDDKLTVPDGTIGTLAPGQSVTLRASAVLDESTTNVATATGTDSLGGPVSHTDSAHVAVYSPSIAIVKSADPIVIIPGALVQYTYFVTNTGDIALHGLTVVDDKIGPIGTLAMLGPGQSATFTGRANPLDDVTNIGTVTAQFGDAETTFFGTVTASSDASVDVVRPGVEVVKTAAPSPVTAGSVVTYTYLVRNTGDVALANLVVTDDLLGAIGTVPFLAVGAEVELTATSELLEDTTNVATVAGADIYGHPVTDTDDETVLVYSPAIVIDKTVSDIRVSAGETVTYSYRVTNAGDIELHDIVVTDDVLGTIGTIATLAPGASMTLTFETAIAADVTNVGTATGEYGDAENGFGGEVSDTDEAVVDVVAPGIEVIKSATPGQAVAGSLVTYTYVVRNTGDVTLYDIDVVDDKLGDIATIPELAAGSETTVTATAVLEESTTNTVVVTGHDADDNEVTDEDTVTVPVFAPSISVVKTASSDVVLSGEVVTYTYLVTNTGDLALHDVAVTDDIIGPVAMIPVIAPGATVAVTAASAVAVDTTNVGTATGQYGVEDSDFFGEVSDSDDAFVDVVSPALTIDKSGSPNPVTVGSTVTYTYVVTNTGDVTLIDVEIMDDVLGAIGTLEMLAPGASATFTRTQVLDQTTTNIATATATDQFGHPVEDDDSVTVDVFAPSIDVEKSVTPGVVLAGESVTYTYVVTNTGTIALSDVSLADDKLGDLGDLGTLEPGASVTVTETAAIGADTTNIATVTGEYGTVESEFFGTVTDSDEAFVNVVAPAIDVTKVATPDAILAGETVTYTYTVTNIGDVPLNDVALTDDKLGSVGTLQVLAAGASAQFTETAALSVPTTNVVEAVGTDDFGHEVTDTAEAFVDVAAPFTPPNLVIDKSADRTSARAGDTVRYTITYRNEGPSPASEMVITDDFDERYVTVTDAAGGVVAGGKITWNVPGPLRADDGPQTITYSVRIDADLPGNVTRIRNVVLITEPTEADTSDNTDRWDVDVTGEPFLPFTGGDWLLLLGAAAAAATTGAALRKVGRKRAA